jgi:hypothetical protein
MMGKADIVLPVMAVASAASVLGFALVADMGALGAAIAVILLAMFALGRKLWTSRKANAFRALQRERDSRCVKAMSQHRHDWMNEIQLLTSYVKLNKLDKLNETVETIREKAMRESRLFRIGTPGLVLVLYSLQGMHPHLKLTWHVAPDFFLDISDELEERMTLLVQHVIRSFAEGAEGAAEHSVNIEMSMNDGRDAVLDMTLSWEGLARDHTVEMMERIRRQEKRQRCPDLTCETELAENFARVTLRVPQRGGAAQEV